MVEWRQIKGFPYEVSDEGEVRNAAGRVMKPNWTSGYGIIGLSVAGTRSTHSVHALVCEAFHGPRPDGHEVDHIDRAKTNNAASNLRWLPAQENAQRGDALEAPTVEMTSQPGPGDIADTDWMAGTGTFTCPNWIYDIDIGPIARSVYINLCRRAGPDGGSWPSQSRIARDIGRSRSTVVGALAELEVMGLLTKEQRINGSGAQTSCLYHVWSECRPPTTLSGAATGSYANVSGGATGCVRGRDTEGQPLKDNTEQGQLSELAGAPPDQDSEGHEDEPDQESEPILTPEPPPAPPIGRVAVAAFVDGFSWARLAKYPVTGKDAKQLKLIIESVGEERYRALLDVFFAMKGNGFVTSKGHNVEALWSVWQRCDTAAQAQTASKLRQELAAAEGDPADKPPSKALAEAFARGGLGGS